MGLFDRQRTNFHEEQPLYTLSNSQNLLVVGLGNVGDKYLNTRHNIGFRVLDNYRDTHQLPDWINKKDLKCLISTGRIGSTRIILIKPTTMMNLSGQSVQKIQNFYKITPSETIVVHDELDIEFGTIRTRKGGGSAGHNGIKSISNVIGQDYDRIRIGIGPKKHQQIDSSDFVLQNFTNEQTELLPNIIKECCSIIDERSVGILQETSISI